MTKKNAFTKFTVTTLAALALMLTLCITSFASDTQGGAELYIGSDVKYYDDISEAWNAAMSSGKEAKLVLKEDWVADENGSFGSGKNFPKGAIGILSKHEAFTLDLNGYKIDRGLKNETSDGYVFFH